MKMKQFLRNGLIWSIAIAMMMGQVVALEKVNFTETGDFSGAVIVEESESKRPVLSGIELAVYSILDVHNYDGIVVYDKEYEFGVLTDSEGKFSFEKPEGEFEVMVKRDSLPSGYAVACHAKRFSATDKTGTFTITQAVASNENISANDEVRRIDQVTEFISKDEEYQIQNVVFSREGLTISGTITNEKSMPFSEMFYFSETDPVATIDALYEAEILSEAQRMDQLCNLWECCMFPDGYCLTPVVSTLHNYLLEVQEDEARTTTPKEIAVQERVNGLLIELMAVPEIPYYEESTYFGIHFESISQLSGVAALKTYLDDLYMEATGDGFRAPLLQNGEDKIQIYLVSYAYVDPDGTTQSTINGVTYSFSGDGAVPGYIVLHNFPGTLTEEFKETAAHEFFHLVQCAYKKIGADAYNWFTESSAVWFSAKYSGYMMRATNGHLQPNMSHMNKTIDRADGNTSGAPYIMTLDVAYGGSAIVEDILESMVGVSNTGLNATVIRNKIHEVIQTYDPSSSFWEAYKAMSRHLTYPEHFYDSITPASFDNAGTEIAYWGNEAQMVRTSANVFAPYSETLSPFGCLAAGYKDGIPTVTNLEITLEFSGGTPSYSVVKKLANGLYTYTLFATPTNDVTITINNFNSALQEVFIAVANTSWTQNAVVTIEPSVA